MKEVFEELAEFYLDRENSGRQIFVFISRILRLLVWTIGGIFILDTIGFDITSLLTGAGI